MALHRQLWANLKAALARLFHDTYERLAPSFGYETRTEPAQEGGDGR